MKITEKMVMELNNELANKGCPFRYEYDNDGYTGNPHMILTLVSMNFVNSFILNLSAEYYKWLTLWFETRGIELSFNNDGSIFWSKNGWDSL